MRSATTTLSFVGLLLVWAAGPAAEPAPPPRPAFTLDRLDPADIPAEERSAGQPKELVAVLGSGRGRHAGIVTCQAVSPDGNLAASGGLDNLVRLWDARTLRPLAVLKGLDRPPDRLQFSPDGRWLVSDAELSATTFEQARDPAARLWAIDGARSRLAGSGKPHAEPVVRAQFVRDGRELLTIGKDGEVRSWDLTADKPAERIRFRADPAVPVPEWWVVKSAEFTPDGRTLFVEALGRVEQKYQCWTELWDVAAGKRRPGPVWRCAGLHGFTWRLLSDGKTLAFGLVLRGEGQQAPVRYVPWGNNEIDIPVRLVLWDLTGEEPKQVGTVPLKDLDTARSRPPAEKTVRATATGNRVRVWDCKGEECAERAPDGEPTWDITGVAFGPDGRSVLATGDDDGFRGRLARWDLAAGRAPARVIPLPHMSHRLVFARNGTRFVGDWVDSVRDGGTGRPVCTRPSPTALDDDLGERMRSVGLDSVRWAYGWTRYALNDDGTVLAMTADVIPEGGPRVFRVGVWDVRGPAPKLIARLEATGNAFTALALSPDGRRLAIGTGTAPRVPITIPPPPEPPAADGEVVVWDVGRAEPAVIARFPAGRTGATALAFTADGDRLAAALPGEERVRVWDLTPKPRERWQAGARGGIGALQFTHDGRLVGLTGGTGAAKVSPGGRLGNRSFVGLSGFGLSLWDADGKRVANWPDLGARALAVAPDGRHVATANANGSVSILRLPPGPEVAPHPGPTGRQGVRREARPR